MAKDTENLVLTGRKSPFPHILLSANAAYCYRDFPAVQVRPELNISTLELELSNASEPTTKLLTSGKNKLELSNAKLIHMFYYTHYA